MDTVTIAFREEQRTQHMGILTEAMRAADDGSMAQHLFAAARKRVANSPWPQKEPAQ